MTQNFFGSSHFVCQCCLVLVSITLSLAGFAVMVKVFDYSVIVTVRNGIATVVVALYDRDVPVIVVVIVQLLQ